MATTASRPTARITRAATVANLQAAIARGVAVRKAAQATAAQLVAARAIAPTAKAVAPPAEAGTAGA